MPSNQSIMLSVISSVVKLIPMDPRAAATSAASILPSPFVSPVLKRSSIGPAATANISTIMHDFRC